MRSFFKYFLASLLAIVVSGIIVGIVTFGIIGAAISSVSKKTESKVVASNSILYLDMSQPIHEINHEDFQSLLSSSGEKGNGLIQMLNAIDKAKTDDNIKGIYIKAASGGHGMSTLQELRSKLEEFKKTGKFIYAYNDYIDQSTYYLVSVADSIFVNPLGTVAVQGLASNVVFFKGTLEKLNVEPEIFYVGQFKSATEPFRMKQMSEPNRKQLAALQSDFWASMLQAFSEKTKKDTSELYNIAKQLSLKNADDAVALNFIDGVKYKDEMETILKTKIGQKLEDKKINFVSPNDYIAQSNFGTGKNKIAVLVGEGQIVDGKGSNSPYEIAEENFVAEIRKVKENKDVKAVVLRINSPGGSALASEVILRELNLLKKEKPVVVSMGDLAASGGYYIACQSDSIFAMPNTITGSIGIFGMMFNTEKLLNNKLGITLDVEKNAPHADFPTVTRTMTDNEKKFIQSTLDTMYYIFKSHVANGRKMTVDQVDTIAQGRVWTGTDALENGLVDGLGGLDRAIKSAAALAKIDNYSIRLYPAPINQMEDLLMQLQGKGDENVILKQMMSGNFAKEYEYLQTLQMMMSNKRGIYAYMPYQFTFQ